MPALSLLTPPVPSCLPVSCAAFALQQPSASPADSHSPPTLFFESWTGHQSGETLPRTLHAECLPDPPPPARASLSPRPGHQHPPLTAR